jgi:hypothetical protein
MNELLTLTGDAYRHDIAYDDDVRTVAGKRYHSACVDATKGAELPNMGAVHVTGRYIERFSNAIRR